MSDHNCPECVARMIIGGALTVVCVMALPVIVITLLMLSCGKPEPRPKMTEVDFIRWLSQEANDCSRQVNSGGERYCDLALGCELTLTQRNYEGAKSCITNLRKIKNMEPLP